MTAVRRILGTVTIWVAAIVAACGGGEAPTRVVEVEHAAASFPEGASHVSYQVLSDAGEWVPLGPEFGLDGRHLVEVPADTNVLLVRAHSSEHEVLAENLYLVPQAEDVVLGAEPSPPEAYSRWMTTDERIQASALNQITIPGAHDAGMGTVNSCSSYANPDTTQTQDSSIKEMLQDGIRYFDMRPIYPRGGTQMRLAHYGWVDLAFEIDYLYSFSIKNYEGCAGYTVVQALEHVREFMAGSGNREVVILKMSHFMNLNTHPGKGSYFDPADFDWLEMIVKDKLGPYLLIGNRDFRSTPIAQLTESGPKVIVTFDASERPYDGSNGIYAEDDLKLYDEYSDTSALGGMKPDQLDKMAFHGNRTLQGWIEWYFCDLYYGNAQCYKRAKASYLDHSPYFVLSWTLTQNDHQIAACTVGEPLRTAMSVAGYKCKTLMELGTEANSALPFVIAKAKATLRFPNVLYVDRAGKKTTETAIAINRLQ